MLKKQTLVKVGIYQQKNQLRPHLLRPARILLQDSAIVYWTTSKVFDYEPINEEMKTITPTHKNETPRSGRHETQIRAEQMMAQVALKNGVVVKDSVGFAYMANAYFYDVRIVFSFAYSGWLSPCCQSPE